MCGIVGFVDFSKRTSREVIGRMTDALLHRGPDDLGTFDVETSGFNLAFGHTRLSILDLSPLGHQPMETDRFVMTFNGEIYNFEGIRNELIADGVKFKSHSDSEVILRIFEKEGINCLQRFRGMYALALFDRYERKLWLIRDRVGVKPLYYYFKDDLFMFGSELKSFHRHPGFHKEIDVNSLGLFLQYNYIPGDHCIFKHTQKVPPGHYLEISLDTKQTRLGKYWDVTDAYRKPVLDISEQEAIEQTEKVLTESFNLRMVADVPVGIFLSGGFDSSAVAALLQKDRTEKLKTFTIGFDVNSFDEAPEAKKIANRLGTDHTEYYCSPADALEIIPRLPDIYDEPFSDNSVVPTVLVSKLARKSVTVALSGDGGDEIFAGYDKFNRSLGMVRGWKPIRKMVASAMEAVNPNHIPVLRSRYNAATRYEKVRQILNSEDPSEALKVISQHIPQSEAKNMVRNSFIDYPTHFDLKGPLRNGDHLAKLLAIDYMTFLTDNNLTKMDRATMSVALEGREPFLDQNVVEFVAQLPSDLKIRNGVNKYILKQIVYKYLSKELMDRPKKPFLAPLNVWFLKQLKDFFLEYLDRDRLLKEGYLNPEPIVRMRDEYLAGKPVKHQKLWNVLIFEMWYERWMK